MEKAIALKHAGSTRALAEMLGITTQAVRNWRGTVPELQVYRLKELRPAWFKPAKMIKQEKTP